MEHEIKPSLNEQAVLSERQKKKFLSTAAELWKSGPKLRTKNQITAKAGPKQGSRPGDLGVNRITAGPLERFLESCMWDIVHTLSIDPQSSKPRSA